MADITKCQGFGCLKKESCYRFTASASTYQSYFCEVPLVEEDKKQTCEYYWEEEKRND